jgi:hypothetical protein
MKPNSQRNKMLKGGAKKIFSVKTMTRKKKFELTWANLPNMQPRSWHRNDLIEKKEKTIMKLNLQ